MSLLEQVNQGIKDAMRSRDQIRLETLRMLKSKILAADARGNLADADIIKLFKTYFGNLQEAYEQAKSVNRPDIFEKLALELAIVQEYLPQALSLEETKSIVMQALEESGAKTKKDFGQLMKCALKLNSTIDGKLVKELAAHLLSD